MSYEEKLQIFKKFCASTLYEDKLIAVSLIDEDIVKNISRVELNEMMDVYVYYRPGNDLWIKIFEAYEVFNK